MVQDLPERTVNIIAMLQGIFNRKGDSEAP
jgi:hypothetical protein